MLRLGLVAVLVAAVAAAATPVRSQTPSDEIHVTRDSISLPVGCSPRQVATLLRRFTAASNGGDAAALRRLFARQSDFRWYSVSEGAGRSVTFYNIAELFSYFARRHLEEERLGLLSVDVGPSSAQTVGIGYALRREANDLEATLGAFAHGKAEIDCRRQRIYVWSMGQDGAPEPFVSCPKPPTWTATGPVLACSRSGSAPNAQEVTPGFRLAKTPTALPKPCSGASVETRVVAMLRAFNLGAGDRFARGLTATGHFHPYTASILQISGRAKIAAFIRARHAAGDGWTAVSLHPPNGGVLRGQAVYQLWLRVPDRAFGAKLLIDCRSGLVSRWVGPAVRQPG